MAATAIGVFALAWLWVAAMPLAFLDSEYPAWAAKRAMLRACDLGAVVIAGDSRAAAGVLPNALPVPASNLAIGGGEPVETYAALRRALACPHPPRRVVLSLDAGHFMHADLFWERSVRFGWLDDGDLADVAATAAHLGDHSLDAPVRDDGLPARWRRVLYAWRFPPLYAASLLRGGVLLRWRDNAARLTAATARGGQYGFGTDAGSHAVAIEAHLPAFRPLPVQDAYFDRTLALLASRGIAVDFLAVPMNEATWRALSPALRDGFAAYLAGYTARYANFHLLGPAMTHWPDRFFGDAFAHLNAHGAARYSAALADCVADRMAGVAIAAARCALDWPSVERAARLAYRPASGPAVAAAE